jgi:hypothetical protein
MEQLKDATNVKGGVTVKVIGPDGTVKQEVTNHNLVVTVGKAFLATWLAASTQSNSFMPYTAVGTGTATPLVTDTALQTELVRSTNTPFASSNILSLNITFGPGIATGSITEAGLFSGVFPGTMFSHVVFGVVTVGVSDSLIVNWSVTFS